MILSKETLQQMMTQPSPELIRDVKRLDGDLMIIGAGGKVGPTLAIKARKAFDAAGSSSKVYAVSLFDYTGAADAMRAAGVEVWEADISDPLQLERLPQAENIIYMVGKKFGTTGNESATWQTNVILPYLVAQRFPASRIVAFSTGNVYGEAPLAGGGSCEEDTPIPVGEYAQTCLGRERILEHCSRRNKTPMLMFRLNYAIDLRYGVLYDIASAIMEGRPVDLSPSVFNCIWQGDVCEYAIRSLLLTAVPPTKLNISSPEAYSVRWAATELGKRLGREPVFAGTERQSALFSNCQQMVHLLGHPETDILTMMDLVAEWVRNGGEAIDAPTHFETIDGKY